MSAAPVQVGDLLARKYRVERVLGVGGMGVVVAARHIQLDELVAVKLMLPEVLRNPAHVTRFLREAKTAIRLRGEHVARVLDAGTLDTGAPYIAMEYLDGEDLAALLERRGRIAVEEACSYMLQTCEAMAEAHAAGIVHRDLKPQNLYVTRRPDGTPSIKVLDFGISKSRIGEDDEHYQATHTSAMMGSPAYMSPEQIESSRRVDARGDIWALGVILFQLLTGRLPFTGDSVVEICIQVLNKLPPALRTLAPAAPAALEATVARCLEKDREGRYANVAGLVAELAPFAPDGHATLVRVGRLLGLTTPAPSDPPPSHPVRVAADTAPVSDSAARTVSARRRWPAVALGLGVAITAASWLASSQRDSALAALEPIPASAAPPSQPAVVLDAPRPVAPHDSGGDDTLEAALAGVVAAPPVPRPRSTFATVPRPQPPPAPPPVEVVRPPVEESAGSSVIVEPPPRRDPFEQRH